MNDEGRDPDLDWVRSHWKTPQPSGSLAERVFASYHSHLSKTSRRHWVWWIPIPVAAAAALAFMTLTRPAASDYYRIVAEPRLIIVSQGERP